MASSVVTCELCDDLRLTDTAYEKHVAVVHPPKEEAPKEDQTNNKPAASASPRKPERK